jgi:hypothetical protein
MLMKLPPPLALKRRHGVNGGQVDALHVDGVAAVELVLADFERRAVAVRPAGVVDHRVELAVALHSGVHQRLDLGGFRHVGLEEGRVATGAQDFLDHLVAQRFVDVIDDDARAFGRQPQARCPRQCRRRRP